MTAQFTSKLVAMLEENKGGKVMCYNDGAVTFEAGLEELESCISRHFRHRNWASFQRQLNYHGFKKTSGGRLSQFSKVVYLNQELVGMPVSAILQCRKRHASVPDDFHHVSSQQKQQQQQQQQKQQQQQQQQDRASSSSQQASQQERPSPSQPPQERSSQQQERSTQRSSMTGSMPPVSMPYGQQSPPPQSHRHQQQQHTQQHTPQGYGGSQGPSQHGPISHSAFPYHPAQQHPHQSHQQPHHQHSHQHPQHPRLMHHSSGHQGQGQTADEMKFEAEAARRGYKRAHPSPYEGQSGSASRILSSMSNSPRGSVPGPRGAYHLLPQPKEDRRDGHLGVGSGVSDSSGSRGNDKQSSQYMKTDPDVNVSTGEYSKQLYSTDSHHLDPHQQHQQHIYEQESQHQHQQHQRQQHQLREGGVGPRGMAFPSGMDMDQTGPPNGPSSDQRAPLSSSCTVFKPPEDDKHMASPPPFGQQAHASSMQEQGHTRIPPAHRYDRYGTMGGGWVG